MDYSFRTTDVVAFVDRTAPASLAKLAAERGNPGLGCSDGAGSAGIAAFLSANCSGTIAIACKLKIAITRECSRQIAMCYGVWSSAQWQRGCTQ